MGWVTLSLRRMEDSVMVNYLELDLIQLSRRRMSVLRNKNLQSLKINNEKRQRMRDLANSTGRTKAQEDVNNAFEEYAKATTAVSKAKMEGQDTSSLDAEKDKAKVALDKAQNDLSNTNMTYQEQKEILSATYDDELSTLEAESTEEENELDMEQAQIEAQLEAVRQELQAVKQSVSTDIQNTTIKLS